MARTYLRKPKTPKIDKVKLEQEIASRNAVSGDFMDWFNILPDPDPVLRKLGKDISVYKDLLADDQVGSTTIRLKNEVKALEWQLMPHESGSDADKEFKLIKLALEELKENGFAIKDIISQTLNPHFWGLVIFEIVWKKFGNYWLPARIYSKPIEWFKFDTNNILRFHPMGDEEGIPITGDEADPTFKYRFIVLRNEPTYENPYGLKALSRCFWPVVFKRGGLKFFATFVEKYGMPHVTIQHPPGYDEEQVSSLVAKASAMIQDAVIAVPDGNQVTVSKGGEKASADIYKMYIDMNNASIEKAILTNTLSTEQQTKGGYSSANAGNEIVEALGKELKDYPEEFFNRLFKIIVELNFGSNNKIPRFGTYEDDEPNKDFAERDETLSKIGVKYKKSYFIKRYNLKDDEFDLVEDGGLSSEKDVNVDKANAVEELQSMQLNGAQIASAVSIVENVSSGDIPREAGINQLKVFLGLTEQQAQAVMGSAGTGKIIKADKVVEGNKTDAPPKFSEQEPQISIAEQLPDKLLQMQIEKTLKPVLELIKKSADFSEVEDKLIELYPKMDSKAIEDMLTKLIFISEIEGRNS